MFSKFIDKLVFESSDTQEATKKVGLFCGIFGIVTNFILVLIKIFIGISVNSISIMADAVNNLSDMGSSIIAIVGFYVSTKPADNEHPFGHGRAEYISAMILSLMVIVVGIQFLKISIDKIINPEDVSYNFIAIVILTISIFIKLYQGRIYYYSSKKINSKTLEASSLDSKSDVYITTLIIISIIVSKLFSIQIDGYIGLLVSFFIIYSGVNITREVIDSILGSTPDKEFIERIINEIKKMDGIMGCHDLVIHNYGEGRIVATAHAEVSSKLGLLEAHDIIDNAEKIVSKNLSINLLLHMDPIDFDNPKLKIIFDDIKLKLREIDEDIDIHDFRFLNNCEDKIAFDMVVPLEYDINKTDIIKKYACDYIFAKYNVYVCELKIDKGNTII